MFRNRYKGTCNNPNCKTVVQANYGFTEKQNGRWVVWCESCRPQKQLTNASITSSKLTYDGKIFINYDPDAIALIKTLPGATFSGSEKCWHVSLDLQHRRRLLEVADYLKLEVPDELRVVETSEEAKIASHLGLYDYQVEGVNFLSKKTKAILGDEMGLGKTLQSLMTIPKNGRAMIVCRAGLKYNWLDEVQKWRKDLIPVVINGKGNFRWPSNNEVIIINNDILPKDFDPPKAEGSKAAATREFRKNLKQNNPEASNTILIIDEAHDYKNWKAARTRKVKELAILAKKTYGLTGSPLNNRPEDLYGVLETLGLAKEVFSSWANYQRLFGAYTQEFTANGRIVKKICWGKPSPVVPELLKRVMLRRLRSQVLPELPEKTYTNFVVGDIDSNLKKQLDRMWAEWDTKVRFDNDLPPFQLFSEIREKLARNRVPAMLEYVENAEEQDVPLVVFSSHLAPLDALLFRPGWAVINGMTSPEKRQEIVREFQAGKLKGIGVSIQAGGIGINLTHAWKGLFVDLDWSPAANWQAEDRLARIGQKSNKVEIVRMVSDHPLDLHLQKMLVDKMDTIFKAIDNTITGPKFIVEDHQKVLV